MDFKRTNPDRQAPRLRTSKAPGFSLVELLVGVALGTLLLTGVASFYLFSLKSFMCMSNYSDLNAKNRYAGDIISRDIRSASSVASVTTNRLVLRNANIDITYTFDPAAGTLTKSQLGRDLVLLEGVDTIKFSLYQRPIGGSPYEEFFNATPATAKLVGFEWSCSRKVFGAQRNSHSLEAAIVKLRTK
jgi:hypothetical protein